MLTEQEKRWRKSQVRKIQKEALARGEEMKYTMALRIWEKQEEARLSEPKPS